MTTPADQTPLAAPLPTMQFSLRRGFWTVLLLMLLVACVRASGRSTGNGVLVATFTTSLVAHAMMLITESRISTLRWFGLAGGAAAVASAFAVVRRCNWVFAKLLFGSKSENDLRPFFETSLGGLIIAAALSILCGIAVVSVVLIAGQQRGLGIFSLMLLVAWLLLVSRAIELREPPDAWYRQAAALLTDVRFAENPRELQGLAAPNSPRHHRPFLEEPLPCVPHSWL